MKKIIENDKQEGFPNRLRQVRKALGLSQTAIASALGVSMASYVRYEIGRLSPRMDTLAALCRMYSINANWLLAGEGSMFFKKEAEEEVSNEPAVDDPYMDLLALMENPLIERLIMDKLSELSTVFLREVAEKLKNESVEKAKVKDQDELPGGEDSKDRFPG